MNFKYFLFKKFKISTFVNKNIFEIVERVKMYG